MDNFFSNVYVWKVFRCLLWLAFFLVLVSRLLDWYPLPEAYTVWINLGLLLASAPFVLAARWVNEQGIETGVYLDGFVPNLIGYVVMLGVVLLLSYLLAILLGNLWRSANRG